MKLESEIINSNPKLLVELRRYDGMILLFIEEEKFNKVKSTAKLIYTLVSVHVFRKISQLAF